MKKLLIAFLPAIISRIMQARRAKKTGSGPTRY